MVSGTSEPGNQVVGRGRPRWRRRLAYLSAGIVVVLTCVGAFVIFGRPPAAPPINVPNSPDPQVATAINQAHAAVVRAPRSGDAWGHLGMVLVTHEYYTEGTQCLAEAEKLDPREVRWPYFQGVLLANRDPAVGIPKLERAVQLAPPDVSAPRLRLAEALLVQGRWDEAENLFTQVLAQDPENPRARLGLGRIARVQSRLQDSVAYLKPCSDSPFSRHTAHSLLAEIYERQNEHAAAERELHLVESLPADASFPDPLYKELEDLRVGVHADVTRALTLLHEGRVPETLTLLEQTVRQYPDTDYAWEAYGQALISANDYETAEGAFRKAIQVSPNMQEAHFFLGVTLFQQKKYAEAAGSFRRAAEIQPDDAWAHYNLGHCLKEQGKRGEAIDAFRAAVHAKPQFAEAHRNLGELLAEDGNDTEAAEHLKEALKWAPGDKAAQQLLDKLRQKAGKSQQP
jgi:tetratricopeptide (TPR) repeat protein